MSYLIDESGELLWSCESDKPPGLAAYLLPDGRLVRSRKVDMDEIAVFKTGGGLGGVLETFDEHGNVQWNFEYASNKAILHHDFKVRENGNILAIAFASVSAQEARDAGRKSEGIFGEWLWYTRVIEIEPTYPQGGKIVWQWDAWDHLVQNDDPRKPNFGEPNAHPNRINLNYYRKEFHGSAVDREISKARSSHRTQIGKVDWMHANAIDFNEDLNLVLLSVHGFDEIWVIDRLRPERGLAYRWGNPAAYDAGTEKDQMLFRQHDAHWIPKDMPGEGNVLVFNNGLPRGGKRSHSRVLELSLPESIASVLPTELGGYPNPRIVWYYDGPKEAPLSLKANRMSGAQRLPNGNTLICNGPTGRIFQVTKDKELVWDYWNPFGPVGPESDNPRHASSIRPVFKVRCYPSNQKPYDPPIKAHE